MNLRPGSLIGLPPGLPSVIYDVSALRDLLVVLAVASGLSWSRGYRRLAVAAAMTWLALAVAFWTAAFQRPYGILEDAKATRWAADVSVAAGGGDEGFLVGEPSAHPRWAAAARRVGARALLLLPTLLPLVALPAIIVGIAWAWSAPEAPLAAVLWAGLSTLDLDVLRGVGLVDRGWSRPDALLLTASSIPLALALARLPSRRMSAGAVSACVALVAIVFAGHAGEAPRLVVLDLPAVLVLDGVLWVVLGLAGLWRWRDPAACGLTLAGAAGIIFSAAGAPLDTLTAHAFYRVGLVLAATPVLAQIAVEVARIAGGVAVPSPTAVSRVLGVIVACVLAGSLPTWWDPPRLDPVAKASLDPIPDAVSDVMAWVRARTDPGASFLAGEDYAAAVAVLGGRRLLRAPALATATDDERRVRLQRAVLAGRVPAALCRRYGLRYLLAAPGPFMSGAASEVPDLTPLGFQAVFSNAKGVRIYEVPCGAEAETVK